jgi:hypothetical protein
VTGVSDPVLRKTRLLAEPCPTCILNPARLRIKLSSERIREFIRGTLAKDSYVVCHSTLPGVAPPGVMPAVCRGFYDRYSTTPLQLMERLWGFVEVPAIKPIEFGIRRYWPVPCGVTRGPRSTVRCEVPALHQFGCLGPLRAGATHAGRGRRGQWYFWSVEQREGC